MKKIVLSFVFFWLVAGVVGGYGVYYYSAPGTLVQKTNVFIRKGMRSQETAHALAEAGVIRFPQAFYAIHVATGQSKKFKAGEYAFPPGISPKEVAEKLVSGDVVVHKITIPEGWSMREIRAAILLETLLEGDITRPMPEGSVLPETYHYVYGDTRDEVVVRMQLAMRKALEHAWENRAEGLLLASKEEALVLASIVEKETGVADERPRVAAVFVNRLKRGMRLQTDPSVVYGIEQKLGDAMNRPLTRADLEAPTPYNTYVIPGLPPTPIANPGIGAIEAALHPLASDELYFVAIGDGSGGHRFSKTLDEHNKNVAAYRAALKNK
ncbi:MAG: endolytic transglycosylase MltG [Alphaproteobacteria bacterium]|nr:endolytic transglycosylase MltG [Alphaproteobacteria bacterium]